MYRIIFFLTRKSPAWTEFNLPFFVMFGPHWGCRTPVYLLIMCFCTASTALILQINTSFSATLWPHVFWWVAHGVQLIACWKSKQLNCSICYSSLICRTYFFTKIIILSCFDLPGIRIVTAAWTARRMMLSIANIQWGLIKWFLNTLFTCKSSSKHHLLTP